MVNSMPRKDFWKRHLFKLLVFGFFFAFFISAHPLIIYDTDDWLYVALSRDAIPIWKYWNPSRILPEVLMPFLSLAGVKLLTPFTKDIIMALAITFGTFLSVIITEYFCVFKSLMQKKLNLDELRADLITSLFVVLHFLVLRKDNNYSNNMYMFYSSDVTCYFYYTIPTLINIILLMRMELNPDSFNFAKNNMQDKMILCFWAYFGVFSNLFSSHILPIWVSLSMLADLARNPKRFKEKHTWREYEFHVIIIVLWIVSAIFELSGGRADSLAQIPLLDAIDQTFDTFLQLKISINKHFIRFVAFVTLLSPIWCISVKKERSHISFLMQLFAFSLLTIIYLILLCAKAKISYIARTDVLLSFFWGCGTIMIFLLTFVMHKYEPLFNVLPIYLVFLLSVTNTSGITFADSNCANASWKTALALDRYYISTVLSASELGATVCEIEIPEADPGWPLGMYGEQKRIGESLYTLGIIDYPIETLFRMNSEINERFHIENYK